MTPEQVESAKKILEEEMESARKAMDAKFIRNGEDFPDLANLALANKGFASAIEAGCVMTLLAITLDREAFRKKVMSGEIVQDSMINTAPLDTLWLGYRLGRRMEHAEMEAISEFGHK